MATFDALAEKLVKTADGMQYAIFGAGGAEAVEIALKTARYATKRRKIVSIIKGYHGHSGLSVATGTLTLGKPSVTDIVVLQADPADDVQAFSKVQCTLVSGKVVYQARKD